MSGVVFTKRLKEAVAQCGVDPRQYASHSFHRGSATWALACGVPGELVKSMGDWKSAVYLDYLDDLPESVWNSYMHQFFDTTSQVTIPLLSQPHLLVRLGGGLGGEGNFVYNKLYIP